ncbi:MAG: YitT family protein [Oscillospiraceae bacterium]|nr:YitT family protein [Oscillospiraceae bacterium]
MKLTKKELIRNILMIVVGSAVFSLGFDMFLDPNGINCGGVTGIAMLIVYGTRVPWLTVGILTAVINLPLFLVGFKKIGKYFFFSSLAGMLISSTLYDLFLPLAVRDLDPLVAAIFGGVMIGGGLGLVFLAGASTGGTDIVARLIKLKWRNFPLGKIMLGMDVCIAVATGIVYRDLTNTLYSIITLYLSSVVLDQVIYGMDFAKVALIVSEKYEQIATAIDSKLDRGVTLLNGQGYYRRLDRYVLLSAVKQKQVAQLKELVFELDPEAFIILQDARQVLGDGFKRYDRFEL